MEENMNVEINEELLQDFREMNNVEDSITGKKVPDNVGFIESFEEFYFAIKETLKFFVERTMEIINGYEKSYMQINPSPLMSATMDECVNQGKDAYAGGAKYNNTSISVFGIADIVDSVISVKKTVFQDKIMSYDNFCSVVNNDWNNHELLRVKCKNTYPKYGNGNKEVDEIMTDLVEYICSLINNKPNARGGVYRCGFFYKFNFWFSKKRYTFSWDVVLFLWRLKHVRKTI